MPSQVTQSTLVLSHEANDAVSAEDGAIVPDLQPHPTGVDKDVDGEAVTDLVRPGSVLDRKSVV